MLAEKVAAGQLPPVEERLPKNPMVIEAYHEPGQYSDRFRRALQNPGYISSRLGAEPLVTWGPDAQTIIPNLAYKWEVNEDGTEYTFYLREGTKWSDGEPFTADDIMFWYEDCLLNEELTPTFPGWMAPAGEPGVVEKVDDYTVKFKFSVPHGILLINLAFNGNSIVDHCKHYLQQFHPKYADADELAAKVKDGGFEAWYQLFGTRRDPANNPDLPTLRPWKITSDTYTTTATADRNPYYWKVDTEGKQLPYFDQVFWHIVGTVDMIPLKIVSGEVDMQCMRVGFNNYTLLMENREAGDYEVYRWIRGESGTAAFLNQARTQDDEMRELLRNRQFAIALSKAINRDEINQLFYSGLANPPIDLYPESVKNDPEIQDLFEFDLEEANVILDELGLTERNDEGIRMLPSGRPLTITSIVTNAYPIHPDVGEIIGEFWKEVGIKHDLQVTASELMQSRREEGDYDCNFYEVDYTAGNLHWLCYPRAYFPIQSDCYWAPLWGWHYETKGRNGEEAIGDGKKLQELWEEVISTVDADARKELEDEAFRVCAYNLWPITVTGGTPEPCVVKNGVRNVPEYSVLAWSTFSPKHTNPEAYYRQS
jgi:peptide/nickel transport system substrate-binding protein